MEFWNVILGLIRRRVLIFPLLAAAITLGTAGYFLTPLKYVSSTTMVLVTPAFGGTLSQDPAHPTDLTNPMLNFNDNLKTASAILIYAMNTRQVAAELGALDGPTKLSIDDGRTDPDLILNNGPFVYIVGESTSKTEAKNVVIRAQKRMREELIDHQKALNAPPETFVTLDDVVAPAIPEVSRADRIKVGSFAFVLSFLMGLSAAYAWQRRRAERHGRVTGEGEDRDLYLSSDRALDRSLDLGGEESSADNLTRRAMTGLADGEQRVDEDKRDLTPSLTAGLRLTRSEQVTGDEVPADEHESPVGQVAGGEAQSDEAERSADPADPEQELETVVDWKLYFADYPPANGDQPAHRSAELEEVAYPEQELETVVAWKLYSADYPPANGNQPAHSSADHELGLAWDWDLEGLDSDRIPPITGRTRG